MKLFLSFIGVFLIVACQTSTYVPDNAAVQTQDEITPPPLPPEAECCTQWLGTKCMNELIPGCAKATQKEKKTPKK